MPTTVMHPAEPIDELVGGELHQLEAVLEQIELRGRDAERASREFRNRCEVFARGDREHLAADAREVIGDLTTVGRAAAWIVGYLDRRAEELDECRATMSSPEPIPWRSGTSATLASSSSSTLLLTADSSSSI
jgi:hypothetical protein